MIVSFRAHRPNRRGNTAVEYAIVVALIVVACIGTLATTGRHTSQVFSTVARAMNGQGPPPGAEPRTP